MPNYVSVLSLMKEWLKKEGERERCTPTRNLCAALPSCLWLSVQGLDTFIWCALRNLWVRTFYRWRQWEMNTRIWQCWCQAYTWECHTNTFSNTKDVLTYFTQVLSVPPLIGWCWRYWRMGEKVQPSFTHLNLKVKITASKSHLRQNFIQWMVEICQLDEVMGLEALDICCVI